MSTNWQVAVGAEHTTAVFEPATALDQQTVFVFAADGLACDGLLLLAYPLHPAGKPEQLRQAHLAAIRAPVLCCNGTRDALCRRELMEAALTGVKTRWDMHWLDGADHSFHVLKSSGRTDVEVLAEIGAAAQSWVARLP